MSIELRMMTFSVMLGIVQLIVASHAASLQRGYRWSASLRDEKMPPLRGGAPGSGTAQLRGDVFPLSAAVVLAAHVSATHNALTEWGARLYF